MKFKFLFVAQALLLSACNSHEASAPVQAERPALTQVVGAAGQGAGHAYSGEIHARHELALAFRVPGKIIERMVDAGAEVKAGQALARIDPADAGLQAGAARAQYQMAKNEVARYRELRSKGFISQSALDAKEAAFEAAEAQAGLSRNQTDYTVLRAERDGVIAASVVDVGQVVSAGQAVMRLAQSGEREVAIEIPETEYAARHVGDAATVTLLNGVSIPGRLRELSPLADAASRTYAARIAIDAKSGDVALGMTAHVNFEGVRATSALVIPLSAIYQQGKETAVWIVANDHTVSLRAVKVASYSDEGAVIAGGLVAGERIVSAGVHRLSPGEKILFAGTAWK